MIVCEVNVVKISQFCMKEIPQNTVNCGTFTPYKIPQKKNCWPKNKWKSCRNLTTRMKKVTKNLIFLNYSWSKHSQNDEKNYCRSPKIWVNCWRSKPSQIVDTFYKLKTPKKLRNEVCLHLTAFERKSPKKLVKNLNKKN